MRTTIAPAKPLLDAREKGAAAIRELGDQLPAAAALNDLKPSELRTLLRTDDTAWVDPNGLVYFVDPGTEHSTAASSPGPAPVEAAPLADTFALHSNPGAKLTLLLDFDGGDVSETQWNDLLGGAPTAHPGWDPAGDGPSFSSSERLQIQQIWSIVAEDYAPFGVDVTTENPGQAGMVRSSAGDTVYGTRVLITPSDRAHAALCERSCGGVAYLSVFDRIGTYAQPAWVFPQALSDNPKSIAEAASHEAGHNLGLQHDGTSSQAYYTGHGIWAPIMGVGYNRPLSQWSNGAYIGANNVQDDLKILTGYLGAREDEASDSVATPSALTDGRGVIGTPDDVDALLLGTCAAGSDVEVRSAALAPNLDIRAVLYDAAGVRRGTSEPVSGRGDGTTASGVGSTLTVPAQGDGWVVTVEGVGEGTWSGNGYDDYGSLGAYTVGAVGCDGEPVVGAPSTPDAVTADTGDTTSLTLSWAAPADSGSGPVTGYVVSRSGSSDTVTLPAGARSHSFTGLAPATAYRLSVRAMNAKGAGPSASVMATTAAPKPETPSVPRDLTGSYDHAENTLVAYWREPADSGTQPVRAYAIYLDGTYLGELDSTGRGVNITNAARYPEGRYVVGVAAVNAIGSSPVETVTITVKHPAAPSNDQASAAEVLPGPRGSVTGDNTLATAEITDPRPPGIGAGGHSVWYSWTPASDGPVSMTTSGGAANRDTTLAAYVGSPGTLTEVAGNDDTVGLHAAISFDAVAGTRYLVAVDGFSTAGGTGPFTMTWAQELATAPSTPAGVVARPGDAAATITWSASTPNGAPVTGYTVTASPGGKTCTTTALTCVIGDLTNGTAHTFTVTATNRVGTSTPSAPSVAVTPVAPPRPIGPPAPQPIGPPAPQPVGPSAKAPAKVSKPSVKAGKGKVTVTWKAPAANGAPVLSYRITPSTGKTITVRGSLRKVVFKKLKNGRTLTFRVTAINKIGPGAASGKSKKVKVK